MPEIKIRLDRVDREMVLVYGNMGKHTYLLASMHIDSVSGLLGKDVASEIHNSLHELDTITVQVTAKVTGVE